MPTKVPFLWAIWVAVEYTLPPLRWTLLVASAAAPWLPRLPLQVLCLLWACAFLIPLLLDLLADRLLPEFRLWSRGDD